MRRIVYLLPLIFLFVACSGSDDGPIAVEYRLESAGQEVTIIDHGRNASINVPGNKADYNLSISGDFVNIVFDADADWLSADYSVGTITIHADVMENANHGSRTGKVNFTVFNDAKSASGYISVTQRSVTYEDLRALEDQAINYFLGKQTLIKQLPADNCFKTGDDAPFYLLDSNPIVAMRVIDRGSDDIPADNKRVYFRFSRANLLTYYRTGELYEEWNSVVTDSPCFFRLHDYVSSVSAQWGKALQMPFDYGLGYGAKVRMVVSSPMGLEPEISYVTPYLYTVSYFKGEGAERDEIPPSPVYIPFATEADWLNLEPVPQYLLMTRAAEAWMDLITTRRSNAVAL